MSSNVRQSLRRIKPEKRKGQLRRRSDSELPFIESTGVAPEKVLLDTTVYIDVEKEQMSEAAKIVMNAAELWHSPVTEAELVYMCGRLDPTHPATEEVVEEIVGTIEQRAEHRTVTPDPEVWREAGIYAGVLCRLQGYTETQRTSVLHDALIFCTAMKLGLTVFSRNVRDFDLLQQLAPAGRVLFYERVP